MFPDLRDDEQNSVHTSDVDSGRNSANPPAPVWVKLTRPVAGNASSSSNGPRRRRAAAAAATQKLLRRRRAATSRPERMWPDGIIPYVISGNFTGDFSIFNLFWFHFFKYFCKKPKNMSNVNCFQAASAPFSARPCVTGRNTRVWRSQRGPAKRATSSSPTGRVGERWLPE